MRLYLLVVLAVAGKLHGQAPAKPALPKPIAEAVSAAKPGGFVGSSVCRTCHPDVVQGFFKNPHYKSLASGKEPAGKTGCEGCHGPGKSHIEALGGKTTIPVAYSLLTPRKVLDSCLACHGKDYARADIRHSAHSQGDVACNSCHSVHKSQSPKFLLAKQRQPDLCYGCHANVRTQFSMPFKHRVNEGFMNCTDCHNPHGTPAASWRMGLRPRMVGHSLGNEEACLKCHSDKRGPFAFEHAAVRVDGCETCHNPHGSTNAKLLRRTSVFTTCLECHNGAPPFGRTGEGVVLQTGTHDMRNPRYQNCTTCHVRIHGSNADRRFLR
ncbi:MAG: DmsE family decaheme c-type cytochrome [Candidatus Solibacter usitatus]|nr:DmsE family decaheme c-type cytochrome [Candidatus Solibacter usitatus]